METIMKQFVDHNSNINIAQAALPDSYQIAAVLNQQFQHERVPFTTAISAVDKLKGINLFAMGEEMFTDWKNKLVKSTITMTPGAITSSLKDFIEPDYYLKQTAETIFGSSLQVVAQGQLPSIFNQNKDLYYQDMMNFYNTYFQIETQGGVPTQAGNTLLQSYLYKYTGTNNGKNYVVLAGMDYKGIEYYSSMSSFMGGLTGGLLGGIFGGNNQQQQTANRFGYGKPCDGIDWGSYARYVAIIPEEYEAEGTEIFIKFVSTYHLDQNLLNRFGELRAQRLQQYYQTAMALQGMAQQSMQNLRYQQQKTTQMLSQNAQHISSGIMDSWNKKMAASDRMSTNYSEAIRGVNTYTTTTGKPVEVSVAADHVYENKYGDVYGVSGNEIDNDLLNQLNWTKISK